MITHKSTLNSFLSCSCTAHVCVPCAPTCYSGRAARCRKAPRQHSCLSDSMMMDKITIIPLPLHRRKFKCTIFVRSTCRGCCTSQHRAQRCPFGPQIPNIPFSSLRQRHAAAAAGAALHNDWWLRAAHSPESLFFIAYCHLRKCTVS